MELIRDENKIAKYNNNKPKFKSVCKWLTCYLEELQMTPEDELISADFVLLMYAFLTLKLLVGLLKFIVLIIKG